MKLFYKYAKKGESQVLGHGELDFTSPKKTVRHLGKVKGSEKVVALEVLLEQAIGIDMVRNSISSEAFFPKTKNMAFVGTAGTDIEADKFGLGCGDGLFIKVSDVEFSRKQTI